MNYHPNNDWRNRRNLLNHQHIGAMIPLGQTPYSIANYSTDTQHNKSEMKEHFGNDILLSRLHMIPNPLQKNLADTIVTSQHSDHNISSTKINETHMNNMAAKTEETADNNANDYHSTFSGIASFVSGVFNIISGSFFQRQTKSEMECFDKEFDVCSQSFNAWQSSNFEDLNKNSLGDDQFSSSNIDIANINHSEMINDCHSAVEQCEDKLGKVRLLLSNGVVPIPQKSKPRRPRRAYVEASSVEDNFEDAFCPEDFSNLASESYVDHISPYNIQNQELHEIEAAKVKTEVPLVNENMEIVNNLNLNETKENNSSATLIPEVDNQNVTEPPVIVLSCEEKLNKLKILLEEKKNKCRNPVHTPDSPLDKNLNNRNNRHMKTYKDKSISTPKIRDKRFKNPHKLKLKTSKKTNLKRNILDDMSFANEIGCDSSSIENSPSINPGILNEMYSNDNLNKSNDYFDEISGRFHTSSTTESDDSFQIVFTDSPKRCQPRRISDCDSEDSFIVFEDPLDCYTSTDVFGDELSDYDSEYSDTESDYSDSGCAVMEIACKLSHALSRTVGDLTDDSLYEGGNKFISDSIQSDSEDEIDSSPKSSCQETPESINFASDVKNIKDIQQSLSTGLLIDEAKKSQRKNMPPKKVQFSSEPPKVHVMRVWAFAARQARMGHWERHALDRDRFKRRIADVEMAVSWVLKPQHRARIMFQRFMPWWNAQKRKEIEEKKLKQEEAANNLELINLEDKIDNRPVDNVDKGLVNIDNITNLVVGIGDKEKIHNLGNEIESEKVKIKKSDDNLHEKTDFNAANQNSYKKNYENVDSNSKDKIVISTETNEISNCITANGNKTEENFHKNKDTAFINGCKDLNVTEKNIYCGVDIENKMNKKRNEIFEKPKFIGLDDTKENFTKKINECNDKLPDTKTGCNIKSTLSNI